MKKSIRALSVLLSSALVMPIASSAYVFAAEDDTIEKKSVNAYLYNMEKTTLVDCLFTSSLPEVPYIKASDYMDNVLTTKVSETKNDDGTFTFTNKNGSMTVDTENDTVTFTAFEDFMDLEAESEGTMLDSPYCKPNGVSLEGESQPIVMDLKKYNIDLISYDEGLYFPLQTISDLFYTTYNSANYVDGNIYFIHMMNEISKPYVDLSSFYNTLERKPEMVEYTYNELCFVIDHFYGAPLNGKIAPLVREKGFDKALDEFSDGTRTGKELLKSDNLVDYMLGLCWIDEAFADGGHTALVYSILNVMQYYQTSAAGQEIKSILKNSEDPNFEVLGKALWGALNKQKALTELTTVRDAQYKGYELVKTWDGEAKSRLYRYSGTALFVFDAFQNDAVYAFKESLDYAAANGLKRFVIDVSCNTGGNSAVVMYMMGILTNGKDHNNTEALRCLNTLTGLYSSEIYQVDLNLDDKIDELDNNVVYDLDFAVITSHFSFSCGNLLPVLAQDSGVPIFGETSGGGSCILSVFKTPEEQMYSISGYKKFVNAKNEDADVGAPVNYDLTNAVVDSDGTTSIDYSGLYDLDYISVKMNDFYNISEEPSEEPSNEPAQSEDPTDQPVEEPSEQPQSGQDQPSQEQPIVSPGTVVYDTGDSSAAWSIVIIIVLASATAVFAFRRKKTEE